MMEPADLWKRHDLSDAVGLDRSSLGGVLVQRKMGAGSVIIIEVRNKDPSQMPFVQDDHVVQTFAPHAADQALYIRILPRASWRRDDLFHAYRHRGRAERMTVCTVKAARRHGGFTINPHLYRHLAAYFYLPDHPGDYETIRRLLGHKSLETTLMFYADFERLTASRRFAENVLERRLKATTGKSRTAATAP